LKERKKELGFSFLKAVLLRFSPKKAFSEKKEKGMGATKQTL